MLNFFTIGFNQAGEYFPHTGLAAALLLAQDRRLGGLSQIPMVFGQVQGAFSWFVTSYQTLVTWRATVSDYTAFRRPWRRRGWLPPTGHV